MMRVRLDKAEFDPEFAERCLVFAVNPPIGQTQKRDLEVAVRTFGRALIADRNRTEPPEQKQGQDNDEADSRDDAL